MQLKPSSDLNNAPDKHKKGRKSNQFGSWTPRAQPVIVTDYIHFRVVVQG